MTYRIRGQVAILAGLVASAAIMIGGVALAEPVTLKMIRIASDAQYPGGPPNDLTVAQVCKFSPGTFKNATATVTVDQPTGSQKTDISIEINNAVPNTLYTVWQIFDLNLPPPKFTFSPLTTDPVAPLVTAEKTLGLVWSTPSEALDKLDAAGKLGVLHGKGLGTGFVRTTGLGAGGAKSGWGDPHPSNGFWTDENGGGEYRAKLNFALFRDPADANGYPFKQIKDELEFTFGKIDESQKQLRSIPVNGTEKVPAKLSIVSHCWDGVGHGLVSGTDERWFWLVTDPPRS